MASPLFCERLRHDLGLELLLDVHPSQSPVLFLQLLHPGHHRGVHASELGSPLVQRRRANTQLPAQIRHRDPRLRALERVHDLAVRKPRLLHFRRSLHIEEILLLSPSEFRGDYPTTRINQLRRRHLKLLGVPRLRIPLHPSPPVSPYLALPSVSENRREAHTDHQRARIFAPPSPAKKILTTLSLNSVSYFAIKPLEVCPTSGVSSYPGRFTGRIHEKTSYVLAHVQKDSQRGLTCLPILNSRSHIKKRTVDKRCATPDIVSSKVIAILKYETTSAIKQHAELI
jgi:hypothetical protein